MTKNKIFETNNAVIEIKKATSLDEATRDIHTLEVTLKTKVHFSGELLFDALNPETMMKNEIFSQLQCIVELFKESIGGENEIHN